mgnify:CR=1 FL=1
MCWSYIRRELMYVALTSQSESESDALMALSTFDWEYPCGAHQAPFYTNDDEIVNSQQNAQWRSVYIVCLVENYDLKFSLRATMLNTFVGKVTTIKFCKQSVVKAKVISIVSPQLCRIAYSRMYLEDGLQFCIF